MTHCIQLLTQIGQNEEWRCIVPCRAYSSFPWSWHWRLRRMPVCNEQVEVQYARFPSSSLGNSLQRSLRPSLLSVTVPSCPVHSGCCHQTCGSISGGWLSITNGLHVYVCSELPCLENLPVLKTYRFLPHSWWPCFDWWPQKRMVISEAWMER